MPSKRKAPPTSSSDREAKRGKKAAVSAAEEKNSAQWPCPNCTFLNEASVPSCSMCGVGIRPGEAPASNSSNQLSEEAEARKMVSSGSGEEEEALGLANVRGNKVVISAEERKVYLNNRSSGQLQHDSRENKILPFPYGKSQRVERLLAAEWPESITKEEMMVVQTQLKKIRLKAEAALKYSNLSVLVSGKSRKPHTPYVPRPQPDIGGKPEPRWVEIGFVLVPRQDTTKAEKGGNATFAVPNKLPYHVTRLLSSIGLDWGTFGATFGASYIRKKIEPFNQMIVDELIDTIPSMIGVLAEIIAGYASNYDRVLLELDANALDYYLKDLCQRHPDYARMGSDHTINLIVRNSMEQISVWQSLGRGFDHGILEANGAFDLASPPPLPPMRRVGSRSLSRTLSLPPAKRGSGRGQGRTPRQRSQQRGGLVRKHVLQWSPLASLSAGADAHPSQVPGSGGCSRESVDALQAMVQEYFKHPESALYDYQLATLKWMRDLELHIVMGEGLKLCSNWDRVWLQGSMPDSVCNKVGKPAVVKEERKDPSMAAGSLHSLENSFGGGVNRSNLAYGSASLSSAQAAKPAEYQADLNATQVVDAPFQIEYVSGDQLPLVGEGKANAGRTVYVSEKVDKTLPIIDQLRRRPRIERLPEGEDPATYVPPRMLTFKGGVLGDEMGLGKTLTTLSLLLANPHPQRIELCGGDLGVYRPHVRSAADCAADGNAEGLGKVVTPCTLLVCPSHLAAQWVKEAEKWFKDGSLKIQLVTTKPQHEKLSHLDVLTADLIIVSVQFLTGTYYKNFIGVPASKRLQTNQGGVRAPELFSYFWNRLLLDEGHEVDAITLVGHIQSRIRWFLSGTAFAYAPKLSKLEIRRHYGHPPPPDPLSGVESVLKFLDATLHAPLSPDSPLPLHHNKTPLGKGPKGLLSTPFGGVVQEALQRHIFTRHTKESIGKENKTTACVDVVLTANLTKLERALYECMDEDELQRMVCSNYECPPQVRRLSSAAGFGNAHIRTVLKDLTSLYDRLLDVAVSEKDRVTLALGDAKVTLDTVKRAHAAIERRGKTFTFNAAAAEFFNIEVPRTNATWNVRENDAKNGYVCTFLGEGYSGYSTHPTYRYRQAIQKYTSAQSNCDRLAKNLARLNQRIAFLRRKMEIIRNALENRVSLPISPPPRGFPASVFSSSSSSSSSSSFSSPSSTAASSAKPNQPVTFGLDEEQQHRKPAQGLEEEGSGADTDEEVGEPGAKRVKHPQRSMRHKLEESREANDGEGLSILTAVEAKDGMGEGPISSVFIPNDRATTRQIDTIGSKLTHLLNYLKMIKATNADVESSTRVIIFSQWSWLLNRISLLLSENDISNLFCQGNVHVRRKTIEAFQDDPDSSDDEDSLRKKKKKKRKIAKNPCKVIMLSLDNAASGTNLTRATHVILVEPVGGSLTYAQGTEAQAIGRAHRQGGGARPVPLKVVRMIISDTVEEALYLRNCQDQNADEGDQI